jgi:hypothetical protein
MAREVRQQIVQEHLQLANKQLSRLVAESTGHPPLFSSLH